MHACVALIFNQDDQILLQLRSPNKKHYPNTYALPAGKVENSESILEACVREAEEELGLMLQIKDLKVVHSCFFRRNPEDYGMVFYVKVLHWEGQIINKEPEKHPEIKWFDATNLPENLAEHHKDALEKVDAKIYFNETLN